MRDKPIFNLIDVGQLMVDYEHDAMAQICRHPSDPDDWYGFRFDEDLQYLDLYWGNYEYSIPLDEVSRPERLLWKLHHILPKKWDGASGRRVARLIDALARRYGWEPYADVGYERQALCSMCNQGKGARK